MNSEQKLTSTTNHCEGGLEVVQKGTHLAINFPSLASMASILATTCSKAKKQTKIMTACMSVATEPATRYIVKKSERKRDPMYPHTAAMKVKTPITTSMLQANTQNLEDHSIHLHEIRVVESLSSCTS